MTIDRLDERDQGTARANLAAYDEQEGPRVGDYVEFPGGITRRISYIWPDGGAQTTEGGRYHLGSYGVSMGDGSLFVSVPLDSFTDTGETRPAWVWFFHHGQARAHNGVDFQIPVRVYRCPLEAPRC